MIKTIATVIASTLVVSAAASPLQAAPGKPINVASPTDGSGCLVRGSESQPYASDPDCKFHLLTKADQSGALTFLHYQDKGTLQPGQAAPDKPLSIALSDTQGGLSCSGTERVTPSGNYSSDLTCK